MPTHEIISVTISPLRAKRHETITAAVTRSEVSKLETHWTLLAMLRAMNGAERFVTHGAGGRLARVQRYTCAECRAEHIRTHISDCGIDDLFAHRTAGIVAPPVDHRSRSELEIDHI